ncbi:sugar transferase [Streptomyces sp. NPDC101165]|uniref:sugar transferase n=1 Tax=Streptomyces sp. NPDC101165 TaxID=3366119 RepID=UPI00382F9A88
MLIKRVIDLVGSLILMLLAAPLALIVCLAVATTSPGGVFFRQVRAGRDGRPFEMLKFRTMHAGADKNKAALLARNEANGHLFKLRDDPRITPVGRLLRRLSLDELPQLANVMRGEMSLVGPRPLPLADSDYSGPARNRLSVRPGLTCLWQISGRSELSWDDMVRLDLQYVQHRSLRLDLAILARTVPAVLTGKGAH